MTADTSEAHDRAAFCPTTRAHYTHVMDTHHRTRLASLLAPTALALGLALGPSPPPSDAARDAAGRVEDGAAHAFLTELQERHPGRWVGAEAHRAAPSFIADALRDAGAIDVKMVTAPSGTAGYPDTRNVFARIPGRNASRAVVLAAHHDTVGGAPGAIDDGGAVAVLVEVARVLSGGPQPPCDVEFLIFDGEEAGLLGSKRWVADLGPEGRDRVLATVAVELVGWTADDLVVHTLPYGFAWDAEGIAPAWVAQSALVAAEAADVPLRYGDPLLWLWYQPTVRLLGFGTGSDAGAYSEAGIPACMIAGSSLTSFYSAYHTSRDAIDRVSADRLDDATRVTAALAMTLGERASRGASRALGDAYLFVGSRSLSHLWLALLALSTLPVTWISARRLIAERGTEAAALLRALAAATALLGVLGNVAAIVCGVPLVVGTALATTIARPALRGLVLLPAVLPLLVQAMVLITASAAFGFRWRGGVIEGLLLVLMTVAGIGAIVLVRLHKPPRASTRTK